MNSLVKRTACWALLAKGRSIIKFEKLQSIKNNTLYWEILCDTKKDTTSIAYK